MLGHRSRMLNHFFHKDKRIDKRYFPSSKKEEYRSFYLKKEVWQAIRKSKGWPERGSATRLAEQLHVTRQYAAMILSGTVGCSAFLMLKIKKFVGIPEGQCWCFMFDDIRIRDVDSNHPIFNELKYMGEVPYDKYSLSGHFRKNSYHAEVKKT
jgi:hypothetical protein